MTTLYYRDYLAALDRVAGPIVDILGEDAKVTLTDVREYHNMGLCTCLGSDAYMSITGIGTLYLMNSTSWEYFNKCYIHKGAVLSVEVRSALETAINTWLERLAAEKRLGVFKMELLEAARQKIEARFMGVGL
jgi:hypothetical protein